MDHDAGGVDHSHQRRRGGAGDPLFHRGGAASASAASTSCSPCRRPSRTSRSAAQHRRAAVSGDERLQLRPLQRLVDRGQLAAGVRGHLPHYTTRVILAPRWLASVLRTSRTGCRASFREEEADISALLGRDGRPALPRTQARGRSASACASSPSTSRTTRGRSRWPGSRRPTASSRTAHGLVHEAHFDAGAARTLRDLFELVRGRPGSDVLVDGRKVPYAHELWLPLFWIFIGARGLSAPCLSPMTSTGWTARSGSCRQKWDTFFSGAERKPPTELQAQVEALVKRYANAEIRNNGERFRYQSLTARFSTFNELWQKRLRAREEGKVFGQHGLRAEVMPPPRRRAAVPPPAGRRAAGRVPGGQPRRRPGGHPRPLRALRRGAAAQRGRRRRPRSTASASWSRSRPTASCARRAPRPSTSAWRRKTARWRSRRVSSGEPVRAALAVAALLLLAAAGRRPGRPQTMTAIGRDGRRLLPQTLSRLLGEREPQIQQSVARFPPELLRALAAGPDRGRAAASDGGGARRRGRGRGRAAARAAGGRGAGAPRRAAAHHRRPLRPRAGRPAPRAGRRGSRASTTPSSRPTSTGCRSCSTTRRRSSSRRAQLPQLWRSLVERSRRQVPTIRGELFRDGRVVSHTRLDYRSPAWAMASLAYSRAVTATAATWLAAWRDARGDTTRRGRARLVAPRDPRASELATDGRSPRPEAP